MLIHEMDPERSEHISFTMFCHGVEVYLLGKSSDVSQCCYIYYMYVLA